MKAGGYSDCNQFRDAMCAGEQGNIFQRVDHKHSEDGTGQLFEEKTRNGRKRVSMVPRTQITIVMICSGMVIGRIFDLLLLHKIFASYR